MISFGYHIHTSIELFMSMSTDFISLRRSLRQKRRRIGQYKHIQSAQKVLQRLRHYPAFLQAQHIGLYLDAFGEIQTKQLLELCWSLNKKVYLPKICNMNQQLRWVSISRHQYQTRRFALHRLGMYEPLQNRGVHVSKLDFLFMPLLACDFQGTRLGMGGGFYDRTLSVAMRKPLRIGLAHEFQYLDQPLQRQPWDQPLDDLITPKKIRTFRR